MLSPKNTISSAGYTSYTQPLGYALSIYRAYSHLIHATVKKLLWPVVVNKCVLLHLAISEFSWLF